MWLAVDSGNTRVKWAQMQGGKVCATGAAAKARFVPPRTADCSAVWVSHVGSAADWKRLQKKLAGTAPLHRVASRDRAAGVRNLYQLPQQLGSDRWLCLLAARQLPAVRRRGAVVVSAGTALTIDILHADGSFAGGWIVPGLAAMASSLARYTPLPPVQMQHAVTAASAPPRETAAAIAAGAHLAAAAAVQAARRRHAPGACIVLTGGDADLLKPHLPRARLHPQLIFQGMAALRRSRGAHA